MIKKTLKIAASLTILIALLYLADLKSLTEAITSVNPFKYGFIALIFFSTHIAAALRWKNLLETAGSDPGLWNSLRMISISYGFNITLPGNTGDLARSKIVERYEEISSHGEIIGLVSAERLFDIAGLIIVISVSSAFIASKISSRAFQYLLPFLLIGLSGLVLVFWKPELVYRLTDYGPSKLKKFSEDLIEGLRKSSTENLASNMLLTVYIWAVEALVFYLLALAISAELSIWESSFITSIMTLVSSLPLSPAGAGFVEASGTGLATLAGLTFSKALSLVFLQRSIAVLIVGFLGFLIYQLEELEIIRK